MRILITGIAGFLGKHLVEAWRKQLPDLEIWGIARERQGTDSASVSLVNGDLRDAEAVNKLCQTQTFDWVVHLAAQSSVPAAFADPRATWETNLWGTFHLLEALRVNNFSGRFLFSGSVVQYGRVSEASLPIKESQPFRPSDPYGASKAAAELLCSQYSRSYGFDVVLARAFNHIGPRQSSRFAVSDFARQIARIDLGLQEPVLMVGNLQVTRDFLDVGEVSAAYRCLLEHGRTGEAYNVCSGREVRLLDVVETLVAFSSKRVAITVDPIRMRQVDIPRMWGDHGKLTQDTGWRPTKNIRDTLQEVFLYWKEELQR